MPRARVARSPSPAHKWRATLDDGTHVDFGHPDYADYTTHRDPHRMARYLRRHGGLGAAEYATTKTMSPAAVRRAMRAKRRSSKEDWASPRTRGFWSRWLLWSEPTLSAAAARVPGVRVRLGASPPLITRRRRTARRSRRSRA